MNIKEIDSKIEVISSYLELIKSNLKVISLKTETTNSDIKSNSIKIEVSTCESYVNKLKTEVDSFKTELTDLKTAVSSSENPIEIRDERLWKLLYNEMKKESGTRFQYMRVPNFTSAIFLLIAQRETCSTHEIKTNFKIRQPSYLRYMKYLRQWGWVEHAPGRKREVFVLSKKGGEVLQRVLSAGK